jgi:hypothetical protein
MRCCLFTSLSVAGAVLPTQPAKGCQGSLNQASSGSITSQAFRSATSVQWTLNTSQAGRSTRSKESLLQLEIQSQRSGASGIFGECVTFKDGEFVSWRHPADQFAWDRTFEEFVSSGVDPFNEWYCNEIVEHAKPDYNDVGRFNWWLTEQVETVRIEDVEKINKILRSHGCETEVGHDNRTGVGLSSITKETIETIRGYYEGVAA